MDRFWNRFLAVLLGLVLVGATAGCEAFGNDDDDDDNGDERISTRDRDVDRDVDRRTGDRDVDADGIPDRGERARVEAGIPRDAELVARGDNKDLTYRARDNGRIFVQDLDDNERLVYSGSLDRNDEFRLEGDSGRIVVNGRTVKDLNTPSSHKYRVYFDRE